MSPSKNTRSYYRFSPKRHIENQDIDMEEAPSTPIKNRKNKYVPQTAKYEICENGSPIRQVPRHPSNESFDKLLRAPMKANCQGVQQEASLFIVAKQSSGFTGDESVSELNLERMADFNKFSYESPDKKNQKCLENGNIYCDSTDYTDKKRFYQNVSASKFLFRGDGDFGSDDGFDSLRKPSHQNDQNMHSVFDQNRDENTQNQPHNLKITSLFDKFEPDMNIGGLFGNINSMNKAKSSNEN
jgi:hypothetical protein